MITLVMLSGGIDSTYALCKILRETDDEVLVHHVHLKTNAGRYMPEAASCEKIVPYLKKNVRHFHYSESTIDHRRFIAEGYDIMAVALEAGMVASSYHFTMLEEKSIDRWVYGLSSDDAIPERRLTRARDIARFNAMIEEKPEMFIFPRISLRAQIEYIEKELFDMTWSCRFPVNPSTSPEPCGKCISCERRRTALHGLFAEA